MIKKCKHKWVLMPDNIKCEYCGEIAKEYGTR